MILICNCRNFIPWLETPQTKSNHQSPHDGLCWPLRGWTWSRWRRPGCWLSTRLTSLPSIRRPWMRSERIKRRTCSRRSGFAFKNWLMPCRTKQPTENQWVEWLVIIAAVTGQKQNKSQTVFGAMLQRYEAPESTDSDSSSQPGSKRRRIQSSSDSASSASSGSSGSSSSTSRAQVQTSQAGGLLMTQLISMNEGTTEGDQSSYAQQAKSGKRVKSILKEPCCKANCKKHLRFTFVMKMVVFFWALPKVSQDVVLWSLQQQSSAVDELEEGESSDSDTSVGQSKKISWKIEGFFDEHFIFSDNIFVFWNKPQPIFVQHLVREWINDTWISMARYPGVQAGLHQASWDQPSSVGTNSQHLQGFWWKVIEFLGKYILWLYMKIPWTMILCLDLKGCLHLLYIVLSTILRFWWQSFFRGFCVSVGFLGKNLLVHWWNHATRVPCLS